MLQWQEVGDTNVDIGANPSAEEAVEGVDPSSRKVVDIIDGFRLVVRSHLTFAAIMQASLCAFEVVLASGTSTLFNVHFPLVWAAAGATNIR